MRSVLLLVYLFSLLSGFTSIIGSNGASNAVDPVSITSPSLGTSIKEVPSEISVASLDKKRLAGVTSLYEAPEQIIAPTEQELDLEAVEQNSQKLAFSFQNTPLADIVNMVAAYKKINIILPADATFRSQRITYHNDQEVTVDVAWNLTLTFLDLAGYTVSIHAAVYTIVPTANNAYTKEVLPLYINVHPDKLPFSDQRIRAVFYLSNLVVPTAPQQSTTFGVPQETATNPITAILNDMTAPGSAAFDPGTNAIIITEKANTIATAMKVIFALDEAGVQETVEIVPLYNTTARTVADFFRNSIFGLGGQSGTSSFYGTRPVRTQGTPYFAPTTHIVNDDRTNSLILLGRAEAINRIRDFIENVIDVPPETGKSVLHTLELNYLDAKDFAPRLRQIVTPVPTDPAEAAAQFGQSTQVTTATGPVRFFENPIIAYETYEQVVQPTPAGGDNQQQPQLQPLGSSADGTSSSGLTPLQQQQPPYLGGNRLIVAARNKDWELIKELVKKLDTPEDLLIANVLIMDIVKDTNKAIQSTIRNPSQAQFPPGVNFQAAHLPAAPTDALVYDAVFTPTSTLAVDLLQFLAQRTNNTLASNPPTTPGSLLISINDPNGSGITEILQILRQSNDVKVLQQPYFVIKNNQQATIQFQDIRRDSGDPVAGPGGVTTIPQIDLTAQLQVQITPRISSDRRANLQVNVAIGEFTNSAGSGDNTRRERALQTNVNMSTDQVLALGGLTAVTKRLNATGTPLLSRIPIIKSFFSGTNYELVKSELLILINITIFRPYDILTGKNFTTEKLCNIEPQFPETCLFDNLRDPVTRFFFKEKVQQAELTNNYLDHAETEVTFRFNPNGRRLHKPDEKPLKKTVTKRRKRVPKDKLKSIVAKEENPLKAAPAV